MVTTRTKTYLGNEQKTPMAREHPLSQAAALQKKPSSMTNSESDSRTCRSSTLGSDVETLCSIYDSFSVPKTLFGCLNGFLRPVPNWSTEKKHSSATRGPNTQTRKVFGGEPIQVTASAEERDSVLAKLASIELDVGDKFRLQPDQPASDVLRLFLARILDEWTLKLKQRKYANERVFQDDTWKFLYDLLDKIYTELMGDMHLYGFYQDGAVDSSSTCHVDFAAGEHTLLNNAVLTRIGYLLELKTPFSFSRADMADMVQRIRGSDTPVFVGVGPLPPAGCTSKGLKEGDGKVEGRVRWTPGILNQHNARIIAQIWEYICTSDCKWAVVDNSRDFVIFQRKGPKQVSVMGPFGPQSNRARLIRTIILLSLDSHNSSTESPSSTSDPSKLEEDPDPFGPGESQLPDLSLDDQASTIQDDDYA
ncbi:hypothetical protein BC629DRAFT_1614859 [Irpex lacteus]|nr:hypothetical protein BC629DRAFT_1614859 [Irpex lacteus]